MLTCGLFLCVGLCVSLAAGAQEIAPLATIEEKMVDSPMAIAPAEETKSEAVKSEETASVAGVVGIASYYAAKFHGRRTASGEKFNSKVLTAAHLSLPFGTLLKVTNLQNLKSVIVRVNDRGPHVRGRIVDLSRAAAELIGMRHTGTARVELEILKP
jgi:rare lipoprotein A